ncbi:myomegalin [Chanos chanos]|uniref:Myomegalin n=1 Tax=Chanos chanos TaxID=29144 RepID=A0A6J2VGU1_CHACN|nr:myomegalin-like [Chanos chanos]
MSNSYRTLSQHLNDLKKENFSLKLRIYFLEERIQQKYEDSSEDVYRTNIELKVEVESLKQELQEKQQLLDKALITAESLTNHNEAELQRRCEERQQEIDHMQEVLQTKIQLLQEEAQLARNEVERMATLAESRSQHPSVAMATENTPGDRNWKLTSLPADAERIIEELTAAVHSKERAIRELTEERSSLRERVGELEDQLQDLSSTLLQKERDAEFYQEELSRERLRIQQEMQKVKETALIATTFDFTLDSRMKEVCRICARELCGNQRRWIFHPAAKLNLQVLLSHALGRELTRDGRGEFACSKCAFMLDRMYRFDTVIARVEALSIERLHKLLQEKDRLRQCIAALYRKHNSEEATVMTGTGKDCTVDISSLHDAKYCALLQEDLVYCMYESWAEDEEQTLECPHHQCQMSEVSSWLRTRRCRTCRTLRVADSDYEAVCKVPRKLARSFSCGPSTRYSASMVGSNFAEERTSSATLMPEQQPDSEQTLGERASSSTSVESLDTAVDVGRKDGEADRDGRDEQNSDSLSEEHMGPPTGSTGPGGKLALALCLLENCTYRPIQSPRGSRLPVLIKPTPAHTSNKPCNLEQVLRTAYVEGDCVLGDLETPHVQLDVGLELAEMEEMWRDTYIEYMPFRFQKSLIEEQQSQLNQYECAAGQCVSELQKAQLQVQSLQAKIHESETNNKKLQEKLCEMETELRSITQAAQSQERTIQGLTESLSTKDTEAQELYQLIEAQNATMCKLREMAHRNQFQQTQVPEGGSGSGTEVQLQTELVRLQSSLFSCQLELEASQRAYRQSQRHAEDLTRTRDRLHGDLQDALRHHETTEKYNQDLRGTIQQLRAELQMKEAQLRENETEKHSQLMDRDKTITQLRLSLQEKERLLEEYSELLEQPADTSRPRDALLDKLRSRIRDRDRALERSIDEKFRCLEEKETEVHRLQQALREKERDLERLRCILSNNEETITSLDALVRGRELELEQTQEALRKLKWLKQESDERHAQSLRERDNIITQLQTALHTRSKEAEDLSATLLGKVSAGPSEVVEELKSRVQLKERLFQELLADRSRQAQDHHAQIQDLLNTINNRDQYIKESADRLGQVIAERTEQLQELRRHLASRERELVELSREREREREGGAPLARELEKLQSLLREKEAFIRELMQSQEDALPPSNSEARLEMQAVKEELQLALRKQKDTQQELTALRNALAKRQEDHSSPGHQSALEQIVSEYHSLNEALRAEKKLYQNLTQIQSRGDSSAEKIQTLHTELDTVQALRGQLEEILTRTRNTALALDRGAKTQADFGELSTEDDDDDEDNEDVGSSDEFTDSIEDDEVNLSAQRLSATKVSTFGEKIESKFSKNQNNTRTILLDVAKWRTEVQQLVEQKKTMERELRELKSQLDKAGDSSLAQMRNALLSLRAENEELKRNRTGTGTEDEVDGLSNQDKHQPDCFIIHDEEDEEEGEEEEEGEDEEEDDDEQEHQDTLRTSQGKRGPPCVKLREALGGKRRCTRPHSLDLGSLLSDQSTSNRATKTSTVCNRTSEGGFWQHVEAGLREQAERLRADLALSRQESRELQERLMVSEATVHAQAEQLKDYRELLTETSVQQDSKQVQVDLQDLGYETCGRSENEAEREDASSPEFDDLEMCTSLSRQDYGGTRWGWQNDTKHEDPASLQSVVKDLRAQLSRCHKVIRSLQLRVRSLSATSDYASSLERTPRKVNWAFQASPSHSGLEEDEGWQSDGPRPNRELQELVSRVASLESQLKSTRLEGKGVTEDGKCPTWPGKYNTLIQAQARELSHLRQRMREGRGICHILTQHLGDTTKAFEELLRANDIDYYMGQSFREQLAQSTALAQRVSTKISGRDRSELHDDKMGHELLAIRLSKELQQKDKIIESLHTKLQQRPDTPSSSRAPSETTDQSDHTSFVSDERGSTNEDLELCSDVDVASEYAQEETGEQDLQPLLSPNKAGEGQPQRGVSFEPVSSSLPLPQNYCWPDPSNLAQSVPIDTLPSPVSMHRTLSSTELYKLQGLPAGSGFVVPRVSTASTYSLPAQTLSDTNYGPLSHYAFHQHKLGGCSGGPSLKSELSLGENSALWDRDGILQPISTFPGSVGYQTGSSHSGVELIEEHLREIRSLRQRLEDSIRTNERLRQQLEDRLTASGRDGGAATNIYIQGLDTVSQLSNEIRLLKEENLNLQSRLQASRDSSEELEQLREAVLSGHVRLKQAELEANQWKEELRRLQTHSCEQSQQIQQLRAERQSSQECTNRLQHEVSLLQQQLSESRQLLHSLQSELQLYDRVCGSSKSSPAGYLAEVKYPSIPAVELSELLVEVKGLRTQLEHSVQENSALRSQLQKQLEQQFSAGGMEPRPSPIPASPLRDGIYRRQLLHDPAPSPPVRDTGLFHSGSPYSPYSELEEASLSTNDALDPHAYLEGEAPDGSFANRNGRHAIGHVDDFSALQQQVMEGRVLVQRMEAALQSCLSMALLEVNANKGLDYSCVKTLLSNTKTLKQILEEAISLLKMFWRAALPSADSSIQNMKKEQTMMEEIHSLRMRISEQEEVLQGTIQRLRSTNRTKESMETFIVNQLSRTRDVLKKARANLEKNELRISSLSSSSSSLCHGKDVKGAKTGSSDWSLVSPTTSETTAETASLRPAKKRGRECLLQVVSC